MQIEPMWIIKMCPQYIELSFNSYVIASRQ